MIMSAARAGPIPGNSSSSAAVAVLMLRQLEGSGRYGSATISIVVTSLRWYRCTCVSTHRQTGGNGYTGLRGYPVESCGTDTA